MSAEDQENLFKEIAGNYNRLFQESPKARWPSKGLGRMDQSKYFPYLGTPSDPCTSKELGDRAIFNIGDRRPTNPIEKAFFHYAIIYTAIESFNNPNYKDHNRYKHLPKQDQVQKLHEAALRFFASEGGKGTAVMPVYDTNTNVTYFVVGAQ